MPPRHMLLRWGPLLRLVVTSLSFSCLKAFQLSPHIAAANKRPSSSSNAFQSRRRRKLMMTAPANTEQQQHQSSSSTTTTNKNNNNWRTLGLPKEGDPTSQQEIAASLQKNRGPWSQQQYEEALDLYDKFMSCPDSYVAPGIHDALNTLDHAYRLYGAHSVICSFNGGKDAVVILQLMKAAHAHYYRQQIEKGASATTTILRPRALYFEHNDEFPQVISYLENAVQEYDLDMIAFQKGVKFNEGLEVLVQNNIPPQSTTTPPAPEAATTIPFPMAFVLGTRVGDPNAGDQGYFAPSSHYMPPFMRVNPVLEWTYGQVWHFLRVFSLPYCELYDQGYTSLGTTKDTFPCPALAVPGGSSEQGGLPKFWPAYMLKDWSQERAGRVKKEKKDAKKKPSAGATTATAATASTKDAKSVNNSNNNDNNRLPNSVGSSMIQSSPPSLLDASVITSVSDKLTAADPKELDPEAVPPPIRDTSSTNLSVAGSSIKEEDLVVPEDSQSCYSYASNHTASQRTAGLLVIGDEILKGSTADTNTLAAAKAFRENGVMLKRVVVLSDDQNEIVKEVLAMQQEVDVIVTSGGVGPTHDDVTIKSVAVALNRDMVFHEEMAQLLKEKMGADAELTEAQRKMAILPSRSKLKYLSENEKDWPVLQCRNVFILPGVPEFFINKIANVAQYLSSDELERSAVYKVVLSVDEAKIVTILNQAVEKHPEVSFGSYPFVNHPQYKTVLTIEGRLRSGRQSFSKAQMDNHVSEALDYLLMNLPPGSILRVEDDDNLF